MAACTPGQETHKLAYATTPEFHDLAGLQASFEAHKAASEASFPESTFHNITYYYTAAEVPEGTYVEGDAPYVFYDKYWNGSPDYSSFMPSITLCEGSYIPPVDPGSSSGGPTVTCSVSPCQVSFTMQVQAAPPTEGTLSDMSDMWGLFLGAAIVVLCLRKIYDLFNGSPHES